MKNSGTIVMYVVVCQHRLVGRCWGLGARSRKKMMYVDNEESVGGQVATLKANTTGGDGDAIATESGKPRLQRIVTDERTTIKVDGLPTIATHQADVGPGTVSEQSLGSAPTTLASEQDAGSSSSGVISSSTASSRRPSVVETL